MEKGMNSILFKWERDQPVSYSIVLMYVSRWLWWLWETVFSCLLSLASGKCGLRTCMYVMCIILGYSWHLYALSMYASLYVRLLG